MVYRLAVNDRDLDLASALRAVGAVDEPDVVVDAGFFHRTLARWLGLPEGLGPRGADGVRWEYGFWKATFEPLAADGDTATYAADLFRTREGPFERVSWFVKKDARGRIVEAGWLSAPPAIVADDIDAAAAPALPLDAALVARLTDDD